MRDELGEPCHEKVCELENSLNQSDRDCCDGNERRHNISQLQQCLKFDRCTFTVQPRWVFLCIVSLQDLKFWSS